jgi:hypothetical protein
MLREAGGGNDHSREREPEREVTPTAAHLASLTVTTPFMNGCGWQKNWYVPGFVNVYRQVAPDTISPESKLRSTAVTVCSSGSLLVHATVVPVVISIRLG